MITSKEGLIELANYEALSHTKYIDSGGVQTIGIGMTVSEIKDIKSWPWNKALTTRECVDMFANAVKKYENAVNNALKVPVLQHQFDVLVSITYNIGVGGMAKSTFMRRINAKESPDKVVAAMKMWNKDNGRLVKGLVNRRNFESDLFLSGKYLNNGTVGLIKVNNAHKPVYSGRISIKEYL